jgi:hypothetical protein
MRAFMKLRESRKYISKQLLVNITLPLFLAFFLLSETSAQICAPAPENQTVSIDALANVSIEVKPDKDDPTRYTVIWRFIPITINSQQNTKGNLILGTGNEHIKSYDCKAEPTELAQIKNCGLEQTFLSASPTSLTEKLPVVAALLNGNGCENLDLAASLNTDYKKIIKEGNNVTLTYNVNGAFENQDRTLNNWLHLFPYDTQTVEVPVKVFQSAYIRDIEISKSQDRTGKVAALGIIPSIQFEDKTTAFKYIPANVYQVGTYINKDEDAVIRVSVQRPGFQRFWLTGMQILIGLIAGVILGFIASRQKNSVLREYIIEIFGILTIPVVIRGTVYSTYSNLPNILSGGVPSVYDIFFLLFWIVLGFTAHLTKKYLKGKNFWQ